jgi:Ras-related protein Rab-5C
MKPKPIRHKVVFVGPSSSGKTSIISRYAKRSFHSQQPTIGTAFYARDISTARGSVSLNIWDTAGMERYKSLVPRYSRGASAAVAVFDVTDLNSYEAAREILDEACQPGIHLETFFVGNKIDLPCAVDLQDAKEFAEHKNSYFMETSAMTGENIDELFGLIACTLIVVDNPETHTDLRVPKDPANNGCAC